MQVIKNHIFSKKFCFMRRQFLPFFALLLGTTTLISCNNDKSANTTEATTANDKSAENSSSTQVLSGRYRNTESGIRSFTFKTDGSFERAAAASGEINGTTYDASKHNAGNYQIDGENIRLTYLDGSVDNLPIVIYPSTEKDAKPETPFRITIDHVTYVVKD
jgi:hypothetical protein